ncbi:MAG: aldose 1-epimerase [Rhizobiales bacterium]|nr:aldose 1-epimerase [Hyphomicrobiales bacterium]
MADGKVMRLEAGDYQLELCPEGGGCITALRYQGLDVMRPATKAYWDGFQPRESASFPLVPFSNRIADGRFTYGGRDYQLPINMPPEPHAIHGDGWLAAWTVELRDACRAILMHEPEDAPIPYRARQIFDLDDAGLTATLEITNTGGHALPFGFGHHPYFPRTEGLTLQAAVAEVWLPDERKLPQDKVALPEEWDLNAATRLAPLDLDHCFTGFGGRAVMHWPESGLELAIETDPVFGHLVVYVPPGRSFVCVEPVSHVTDGVHQLLAGRVDTGLVVLEPGARLDGKMRFSASVVA